MVFPTIGLDQERNLDACVDYTLATTTGNREHDNHNFKESPNRSAWHRVQRIAKSQCLAPSSKNRQIAVPGTESKNRQIAVPGTESIEGSIFECRGCVYF